MWEVRKAGLNIMMSMKGDGKPVSFIEDCAVPLEHLAEYTDRLTRVFEKHGTRGTWYAHASVGSLHVRPILNMRRDGAREDARHRRGSRATSCSSTRAPTRASTATAWCAPNGSRRSSARGSPRRSARSSPGSIRKGLMNPGKIVQPVAQDDRSLFRFKPGYADVACRAERARLERVGRLRQGRRDVQQQRPLPQVRRRHDVPVVPRDAATSAHLTRGRANTLRLALSGQLGREDFADEAVHEALDLCVSCKGCKRECPTGVDMARMKVEFLAHYKRRHGLTRARPR